MVIPGHNLGNSQVSVNRTIGPTLVYISIDIGQICMGFEADTVPQKKYKNLIIL